MASGVCRSISKVHTSELNIYAYLYHLTKHHACVLIIFRNILRTLSLHWCTDLCVIHHRQQADQSWWRYQMETFCASLALCAGNSQRASDAEDVFIGWRHHDWSPVNSHHIGQWRRALKFFCDPRLNKRLSKQSWGLWFETPSIPSWRHCNDCALKLCENLAVGGWTWLKWLISNGGIPWRGIKVEKCTLKYNDIIQIIFQQNLVDRIATNLVFLSVICEDTNHIRVCYRLYALVCGK